MRGSQGWENSFPRSLSKAISLDRTLEKTSSNTIYINCLQDIRKVSDEPQIGMELALGKAHVIPVSDSDDFKLARGRL